MTENHPPTPAHLPDETDIVVIGGGLAGLTAAATAAREGQRVVLLSGRGAPGRAATDHRDGFALNRGPHALYQGGAGASVLRELGIRPEGAAPLKDGVLIRGGEQTTLPETGWQALRTPLLHGVDKARVVGFVARLALTRPAEVADRTIDEWLDDVVSPSTLPLVRTVVRVATYVSDTDHVSADVAVTQLRAASRGVRYLHGGWGVLADALREAGQGVVDLPWTATGVHDDGAWVHVEVGDATLRARAVVLAPGTPEACSSLLEEPPMAWSEVGDPVTASCLDLGLRRPPLRSVVLAVDEPLYLIAHAPAARLAPAGQSVVHAMRNHQHGEKLDPREVRARLETLAATAGIGDDDVVIDRYLHRMVVTSAAPTPAGGGLAGRPGVGSSGSPGSSWPVTGSGPRASWPMRPWPAGTRRAGPPPSSAGPGPPMPGLTRPTGTRRDDDRAGAHPARSRREGSTICRRTTAARRARLPNPQLTGRRRGRVARFLVNTSAKLGDSPDVDLVEVNGGPGMVVRQGARADIVVTFEAGSGGVAVLRMVLAPAKLRSFDLGVVE